MWPYGIAALCVALVIVGAFAADRSPDDVRLSDLEPRFVCQACGHRGADVRPDFNWNASPKAATGYRNTTK
ncbi:hypothetical protein [Bradyrhizobium sp. 63_E2_N1_3]|uniref:hypothetical protein n=1 Tax=Bradyrhizobium sp. 63_E2_N1_3 TaxID=3240373 RepID=UPI003F8CD048